MDSELLGRHYDFESTEYLPAMLASTCEVVPLIRCSQNGRPHIAAFICPLFLYPFQYKIRLVPLGAKSCHRLPSVINDKPHMKKVRFRAISPEFTTD